MKGVSILLMLILLLGSASLAAAECAWVLWVRVTWETAFVGGNEPRLTEEDHWIIRGTSTSRKDCEARKIKVWDEYAKSYGDTDRQSGRHVRKIPYEHMTSIIENEKGWFKQSAVFHCLPDTIDPREKN